MSNPHDTFESRRGGCCSAMKFYLITKHIGIATLVQYYRDWSKLIKVIKNVTTGEIDHLISVACHAVYLGVHRQRGQNVTALHLSHSLSHFGLPYPVGRRRVDRHHVGNELVSDAHHDLSKTAEIQRYSSTLALPDLSSCRLIFHLLTFLGIAWLLLLPAKKKPDDGDTWNRNKSTLLTFVVNHEQRDKKHFNKDNISSNNACQMAFQ